MQIDSAKNVLVQDFDMTLSYFQNQQGGTYSMRILNQPEIEQKVRLLGKSLVSNNKRDFFYYRTDNKVYHLHGEEKKIKGKYQEKYFEKVMDIDIEDLPNTNANIYMTNKKGELKVIQHNGDTWFKLDLPESEAQQEYENTEYYFIRTGPENQNLLAHVGYHIDQDENKNVVVVRILSTRSAGAYTATGSDTAQKVPLKVSKMHELFLRVDPSSDPKIQKDCKPQYVNFKSWYATQTQTLQINLLFIFLVKYHSFFVTVIKRTQGTIKTSYQTEQLPDSAVPLRVAWGATVPCEKYTPIQSLFIVFRNNAILKLRYDMSKL
jgi:hypothetical protein